MQRWLFRFLFSSLLHWLKREREREGKNTNRNIREFNSFQITCPISTNIEGWSDRRNSEAGIENRCARKPIERRRDSTAADVFNGSDVYWLTIRSSRTYGSPLWLRIQPHRKQQPAANGFRVQIDRTVLEINESLDFRRHCAVTIHDRFANVKFKNEEKGKKQRHFFLFSLVSLASYKILAWPISLCDSFLHFFRKIVRRLVKWVFQNWKQIVSF